MVKVLSKVAGTAQINPNLLLQLKHLGEFSELVLSSSLFSSESARDVAAYAKLTEIVIDLYYLTYKTF